MQVELVFNEMLAPEKHVEEALKASKTLPAAGNSFSFPQFSLPF